MKNVKISSSRMGYFFIALAAFFWGCAATLVKHLFNIHYDPLIIVQTRVSIAFVVLALFTLLPVRRHTKAVLHRKDIPLILFVGIFGIAGSNYFYYFAIKESNVSTAILIQYTAPIIVAIYTTIVYKERVTAIKFSALVLSLTGIYLAVGGYNSSLLHTTSKAIIFAFIAAVSYSIFNIAGKPLSVKYSAWDSLTYVLGAATIFWMVINPPQKILAGHYSLTDWGAFTAISFVSILLPFGFYFAGLRLIQPTQAIITSTLEPVIAVLTENIFLGQSLTLLQGSGGVLVLLAIIILQYKQKQRLTYSHARSPQI